MSDWPQLVILKFVEICFWNLLISNCRFGDKNLNLFNSNSKSKDRPSNRLLEPVCVFCLWLVDRLNGGHYILSVLSWGVWREPIWRDILRNYHRRRHHWLCSCWLLVGLFVVLESWLAPAGDGEGLEVTAERRTPPPVTHHASSLIAPALMFPAGTRVSSWPWMDDLLFPELFQASNM